MHLVTITYKVNISGEVSVKMLRFFYGVGYRVGSGGRKNVMLHEKTLWKRKLMENNVYYLPKIN